MARKTLAWRFNMMAAGAVIFILLIAGLALRLLRPGEEDGWLVLAVACAGVVFCASSARSFFRLAVMPLRRLAEAIEPMERTGRLTKLPPMPQGELEVVASGFNRLVEQVEAHQRRLREHILELQRINAELDQLANVKDDFLATINHQLRTPLTALLEALGLVREGTLGPLNEDQTVLIQSMHENVMRLHALIEEVLDLSLLKSGRRSLAREPADLAALLRRTQEHWQDSGRLGSIRLTCAALPPVHMDAQAIQEALDHLMRNALRHAPEQSEILIEANVREGVVEVAVRDQGPGMSPAQCDRLFEPFTHVHTPDAPGSEGSGLGLSLCRQVVERHRGMIRAESALGKGMRVMFTLPVASPRFLFEDACRSAQEDAEYEDGTFGLLLVAPASSAGGMDGTPLMRRAETALRANTHQGDRFVRLNERLLGIVAVTDRPGLDALTKRLHRVLAQSDVTVQLAGALYPDDGERPDRLLEAACVRFADPSTEISLYQ